MKVKDLTDIMGKYQPLSIIDNNDREIFGNILSETNAYGYDLHDHIPHDLLKLEVNYISAGEFGEVILRVDQ